MRNLTGWIVVRSILVADVVLLVVSGFISLVWVAPPGGVLVAAAVWMIAGGLLGLLPYTDPYRAEQRQRQRQRQRHPGRPPLRPAPPTVPITRRSPGPPPGLMWPPPPAPPATAPEPGPRRAP